MSAPILEMLMMKELFGSKDKSFLETVSEYEQWQKTKKDEEKKADAEKKAKEKPKPPSFSVMQVVLILTGLGPFVGLITAKFQLELVQAVLDTLRSIH